MDTFSYFKTNRDGPELVDIYQLIELLGKGGMGEVWKAYDTQGKRYVALKFLPREFKENHDAVQQLDAAFRLVHHLTHTNICKTLGRFEHPVRGVYVVMDLVEGRTLQSMIINAKYPGKRFPAEKVLKIIQPLAAALDYAHQKKFRLHEDDEEIKGILHRDIKPHNIMVKEQQDGSLEVWLIDYGIAADIKQTAMQCTSIAIDTRGTLYYMAPEQLRGKKHLWDARTDQYALAVVAYQLLAGHLPFDGSDQESIRDAIKNEEPDPLNGYPQEVFQVFQRALSKQKEQRLSSCGEFYQSLQTALVNAGQNDHFPNPNVVASKKSQPDMLISPFSPQQAQQAQLNWAKFLQKPVEITNSLGMKFRLIPPGEFVMGSGLDDTEADDDERPPHLVRITKSCWFGSHQVTRGQFREFVRATGYKTEGERDGKGGYGYLNDEWKQDKSITWLSCGFDQTDAHPVCVVSDNDALEMIKWLNSRGEHQYRLPTEAEWEYTCRCGTTSKWPNGNDPEQLVKIGNIADGTARKKFSSWNHCIKAEDGFVFTAPVGQFTPSPWGIYDQVGNVWEWCADWFDSGYYSKSPVEDPQGASSGSFRVIRGGSWCYSARLCRSAFRFRFDPAYRYYYLGFRLVLSSNE